MATKGYDAGTATPAVKIAENTYSVDSFRGEGVSYIVTLGERPTCTCPHWTKRLAELDGIAECKHITAVRQQQAPVLSVDAALARWEAAHAASQAAFAAVIATLEGQVRPAVGSSVKTYGPTTDAEALAAIAGRQ